MQLRRRLLVSISLVLLVSLLAGAVLSYWTANRKIDLEMSSSLAVGEGTVRDALGPIAAIAAPQGPLKALISSFDGDRHLRASLLSADGREIMVSRVRQPVDPPPRWLYRLLAGEPQSVTLTLPEPIKTLGLVRLQTDPWNEVAEVWDDAKLKFTIVGGFSSAVLALVYLTLGRALKPLEDLSSALVRVGRGDYAAHVAENGPAELATIYREFNRMADRLAEAERQNLQLNDQLSTVQEEERNEIARDLHDDVGPFLFAVDVDAQTIPPLLERNDTAAVAERAKSIRQAVSHMQTHLRSILNRLRPALLLDLGLSHAVDHLVAFWRTRHKGVTFDVDIAKDSFGMALDDVAFRIIQEGLANALRHGRPSRISISAGEIDPHRLRVCVRDDGGGIAAGSNAGFGLTGMRERITALGGSFNMSSEPKQKGVAITVELPMTSASPARAQAGTQPGAPS
jgi:two-component system sensor histidine kinase UhpB